MSIPSLPKNFGQAIDLSQLGKPPVSQNPGGGYEVTAENLPAEILPVSKHRVVFLICWSPRSAESIALLETMSALAAQDMSPTGEPAWIFASVNVDAQPQVAAALQVQAVPTALAVIQEQIAPLFEAAPSAEQIRQVIDKVMTLAAERGVGTAPTGAATPAPEIPAEPEEIEAMEAMERGDFAAAKEAFTKWLNRKPSEQLAKIGLAQTELLLRISGVDPQSAIDQANTHPQDVSAQIMAADIEISQGENEAAFHRLIALIKTLPADAKKEPREHLLGLFSLVDPTDPTLIKARGALASALY
jgi:putative thioredoxin